MHSKMTVSQLNLARGTKNGKSRPIARIKNNNEEKLRRMGAGEESVESILREEESLRYEGFVEKIKF